MAEIIYFLEEAWRTLTDSFILKALYVFSLINYHIRGSEWIY